MFASSSEAKQIMCVSSATKKCPQPSCFGDNLKFASYLPIYDSGMFHLPGLFTYDSCISDYHIDCMYGDSIY